MQTTVSAQAKTTLWAQDKTSLPAIAIAILLGCSAWPASAAPKTVSLAIPSMDCPVCPITLKKALLRVPGVSQADVSFAKRQATVTFDDAKTSVGALTESTKNAGYPSTLVGAAN